MLPLLLRGRVLQSDLSFFFWPRAYFRYFVASHFLSLHRPQLAHGGPHFLEPAMAEPIRRASHLVSQLCPEGPSGRSVFFA